MALARGAVSKQARATCLKGTMKSLGVPSDEARGSMPQERSGCVVIERGLRGPVGPTRLKRSQPVSEDERERVYTLERELAEAGQGLRTPKIQAAASGMQCHTHTKSGPSQE